MIRRAISLIGRAHAAMAYNPFAAPTPPKRQQPASITYYRSRERKSA